MDGCVSIVIPSFNHGKFLREAVESIEKVRNRNLREVIIVNDGSTEAEALTVLDKLQECGYHVIHQKNQGVSAARNAGIKMSTSEFILPVDNDNKIHRPYLEQAVDALRSDPNLGVVYGDSNYFGEKSGRRCVRDFDAMELVNMNYIDNCALFRKRLWEDVGGYDEHLPYMGWEDWDFWMRAALKGWRFCHLNEVAFDYRVKPTSLLSEANQHAREIIDYLYAKKEFVVIGPLRTELHRLKHVENSKEYRLGRRLLAPLRFLQRFLES